MESENTRQTREALEKERSELERRISSIQKSERAETSEGLTDNAHEWENAEIRSDELDEALSELRAVEAALTRLDRGEQGVCSRCGAEISPDRLELLRRHNHLRGVRRTHRQGTRQRVIRPHSGTDR